MWMQTHGRPFWTDRLEVVEIVHTVNCDFNSAMLANTFINQNKISVKISFILKMVRDDISWPSVSPTRSSEIENSWN